MPLTLVPAWGCVVMCPTPFYSMRLSQFYCFHSFIASSLPRVSSRPRVRVGPGILRFHSLLADAEILLNHTVDSSSHCGLCQIFAWNMKTSLLSSIILTTSTTYTLSTKLVRRLIETPRFTSFSCQLSSCASLKLLTACTSFRIGSCIFPVYPTIWVLVIGHWWCAMTAQQRLSSWPC